MPDETVHTPSPKGKPIKVNKISIAKWAADKEFTLKVKVNDPPKLSASGKCYMYVMKQGESDIVVNVGGKDRKLRMTLILYVKVPASERRLSLQEEARLAEASGAPKLF